MAPRFRGLPSPKSNIFPKEIADSERVIGDGEGDWLRSAMVGDGGGRQQRRSPVFFRFLKISANGVPRRIGAWIFCIGRFGRLLHRSLLCVCVCFLCVLFVCKKGLFRGCLGVV